MTERLKRAILKCGLAVTESEQLDAMEAVEDALREICEAERLVMLGVCQQVARRRGAGNVADDLEALKEGL